MRRTVLLSVAVVVTLPVTLSAQHAGQNINVLPIVFGEETHFGLAFLMEVAAHDSEAGKSSTEIGVVFEGFTVCLDRLVEFSLAGQILATSVGARGLELRSGLKTIVRIRLQTA